MAHKTNILLEHVLCMHYLSQKHFDNVSYRYYMLGFQLKQGGPSNIDDLTTQNYVRAQERNIRQSSYELDDDDDASIPVFCIGLLLAVKDISKACGTVEAFNSFMEILVECKEFMDYFKASWYPRIGSWITTLTMMPIASLESSAALEFYHNQLKIRFLNDETDSCIYKRADCCEWGENGNLCEHVCKVIQYHREKGFVLPSVSLLQYKQSLINMLKCPPANSSIRDYAVSLAVWVNEQLSAQFAESA
ncbi:hypothetical protein Tco_0675662 [Tanacetum coccineum]